MKTKILLALSAILATIGAFAANRVVDLGGGKHAAIFDKPGSFRFIVPSTVTNAAILVVGGGGGGGGISGGGGWTEDGYSEAEGGNGGADYTSALHQVSTTIAGCRLQMQSGLSARAQILPRSF